MDLNHPAGGNGWPDDPITHAARRLVLALTGTVPATGDPGGGRGDVEHGRVVERALAMIEGLRVECAEQPPEPTGRDTPAVTVKATTYDVCAVPEDAQDSYLFTIRVEYRGAGMWAVCRAGRCLDRAGRWDYEARSTERDDEWLARYRFDLGTALRLAREAAPNIVVGRWTVAATIADWHREQREAAEATAEQGQVTP